MTRVSQRPQRQRTSNDPLPLGSFSSTSIRLLTGNLVLCSFRPNSGGYGGGSFNHWFKVKLETAGWIILANGSTKPKFINISAYDLNKNPIEGRAIFQADSIDQFNSEGVRQYPYLMNSSRSTVRFISYF